MWIEYTHRGELSSSFRMTGRTAGGAAEAMESLLRYGLHGIVDGKSNIMLLQISIQKESSVSTY
jgi:hypothetical protein